MERQPDEPEQEPDDETIEIPEALKEVTRANIQYFSTDRDPRDYTDGDNW
jgi:hypothetical protein